MANVQAIQDFNDALNVAVGSLLSIRDTLHATDALWPVLTGPVKLDIQSQLATNLTSAKALVAALEVP